jgi:thymidylate synthase (FAD)
MTQELIGKRIPLLDKGWIELADFMPHPATGISGDLAIVNAARVSFMGESKGDDKDKKLLFYLVRNLHTSPFEMVEFKMRVHAPVVVWWQWVRHRSFSMNAQSGRYTEFEEDSFYVPSVWRLQSANNKQASEGEVSETINADLTEKLIRHYEDGYRLYQEALQSGVAREMARLFLPGFSVYYTWVVKVDAHNLMHFLKLRMASDAQYEIRVYAQAIYEQFFKPLLPWTAEAFALYTLNREAQP